MLLRQIFPGFIAIGLVAPTANTMAVEISGGIDADRAQMAQISKD